MSVAWSVDQISLAKNCKSFSARLGTLNNLAFGSPSFLVDSVVKRLVVKSQLEMEKAPLSTVVIPYIKGVSEKFRHSRNQYNIRTVSKTSPTLRCPFVMTRPGINLLDTRHCVCYIIPYECGWSYIGQMGRLLGVLLREYQYNLKQGLLGKSMLAQRPHDGHCIIWKDFKVLQVQSSHIWIKYKESTHVACATQPIRQPSLEMLPV